jgi:hypothetical protein
MPLDLADVVLAGDGTIQDLQNLAKSRLTTAPLRVMTLLAAAATRPTRGTSGPSSSSGRWRRRCGWRRGAARSRTEAAVSDDAYIKTLLTCAPIVEDLLDVAQASASNPRLQVMTLAGALVRAAVEGGFPDGFVLDVVRAVLEGARLAEADLLDGTCGMAPDGALQAALGMAKGRGEKPN